MSDFYDYVLTKDKFGCCRVYIAPGFSCLNPGEEVLVEGAAMPVTVVDFLTIPTETRTEKFILNLLQDKPKKVLKQISYRSMDWEE